MFVSTLEIVQGLDLGVLVFGFIIADVIFLPLIANVLRNFRMRIKILVEMSRLSDFVELFLSICFLYYFFGFLYLIFRLKLR